MKNKAGIRAVTDIAKFKLKESLAGVKVKVGFVGEPGCGKTSLIEAIFGEEIPAKKMEKKKQENKDYMTFKYPGWRNIKFAEIPAVKTHRRVEREAYLEAMNITGYDLIVIVTENHIREWAMWMARELEKQGTFRMTLHTLYYIDNILCKIYQCIKQYNMAHILWSVLFKFF